MPAKAPFTRLCQLAAQGSDRGRADMHVHSTASDGLFEPTEILALARQAGLAAVAITDHDTLDGFRAASAVPGIELICGVEITCEYDGRELHLLGYFLNPENTELAAKLDSMRQRRLERFTAMIGRLRDRGASISEFGMRKILEGRGVLGRRHVARLLMETGQVGSVYEAFTRYLSRPEFVGMAKARVPVEDAIELVRASGGVSSWAHPPADTTFEQARHLRTLGLNALECVYPWAKASHGHRLRGIATELGLAITGGSDCHGPKPRNRSIGAKGVSRFELAAIRSLRS